MEEEKKEEKKDAKKSEKSEKKEEKMETEETQENGVSFIWWIVLHKLVICCELWLLKGNVLVAFQSNSTGFLPKRCYKILANK